MKRDLKNLTREELGNLFPISITEPKTEWKELFLIEKNKIISLLGTKIALRVEHIGSTAVPNLAAKPTIDVLVEIPNIEDIENKIINIMTTNGYNHVPEPEHIMVVKGYTTNGFKGQCYHIHMAPKEHDTLWDRIYFRDYLMANPSIAHEYAILKQSLALKYRNDRDGYTEAKTEFIRKYTEIAKENL